MYLCFSGFALRDADGDLAENATAYVSLEPCNQSFWEDSLHPVLNIARVKKVVGMVNP
ncbi:riboflavin biosynthesis protein PYRD chloroplastic-like, partial [Trifolium medium]|nr:riboflavin biosynthesis protein PYRD chloroplastic-like [Trifolium medium]